MLCENFKHPKLLSFFEEISAIPRASYHEEKISEYLVSFAEARGLEYYCDSLGNVLINMSASADRKDADPLLLQGHTDMVCEKNSGVQHDFSKDPLKLYVDSEGWLRAEGTTLGADNGVAVAVMLCLLDSPEKSHRALQCLFTVSEEVGLDGAKAFDYSRIYARKMVNMDSADESLIIAGCAGGLRSSLKLPVDRKDTEGDRYKITVSGLFGGHSGEDINRGRANANKLMGRILDRIICDNKDARLISVLGGTKENAIPRECVAEVLHPCGKSLNELCENISKEIGSELCADDRSFSLTVSKSDTDIAPMSKKSTDTVVFAMHTIANGVFEMNLHLSGVVEYSRNLGIVNTEEKYAELVLNSRSATESRIDLSASEIDAYARMLGGESTHFNRYPGWIYAERSEIRDEYVSAYKRLFGAEPGIEVIHAGLECGIIKELVPDMDIISCGPVVLNLHSPDEALDLASFERFFDVINSII